MNMKDFIASRGLSQKAIADKMGLSESSLSQMLNRPLPKRYEQLAEAIGCEVSDFFLPETHNNPNVLICPKCGAKLNISVAVEE